MSLGSGRLARECKFLSQDENLVLPKLSEQAHSKQSFSLTPQVGLQDFPLSCKNSARVHERASAANQLAAASVPAALSLPLMIGNRSKCVLNVFDQTSKLQEEARRQEGQKEASLGLAMAGRAEQVSKRPSASVSVVRPVINTSVSQQTASGQSPLARKSIIDHWMATDMRLALHSGAGPQSQRRSSLIDSFACEEQNLNFNYDKQQQQQLPQSAARQFIKSEQEIRQQQLLLRREEHELNRNVRRQHSFVLTKLEERKRHLQIVQSIWFQRDFRHAMESLIDIYHQGLVFTSGSSPMEAHDVYEVKKSCQNQGAREAPNVRRQHQLNSLNTSLVVDVVSIILLRPRLWTLDICQLLLPIIVNDLLMQTNYDYYAEVGLKALKLIVTHFSTVIRSTLESLAKEPGQLGVDLSREDRINKSLNCYRFLLEARPLVSRRLDAERAAGQRQANPCKLATICRELDALLASLESSIDLDPYVMARRMRANG